MDMDIGLGFRAQCVHTGLLVAGNISGYLFPVSGPAAEK
jgi:hypothetical protein